MQGEARQITLAEPLAFFQESYNAVKFKLQSTINKNKDKLVVMPLGLLGHFKNTANTGHTHYNGDLDDEGQLKGQFNPNHSAQQETESSIAMSLYFADTTQFLFVDETSENAQIAAQMIKEVDLGLGNYIEYLMRYLISIKTDAEEYVGFNRYMMAKTTGNDPVANVSNGVYSGSMVLEEYFKEFEEFLNKEYQGIIDRSPYAFREGKKAQYVRSNTDVQTLQVTGALAKHTFGAFVQSGSKSKEVTDVLKSKANEMLQNGMPASTVARIIAGTMNFPEIIQNLEDTEERMMNQSREAAERDNAAMLQKTQMEQEGKDKDREIKIYEIDMGVQKSLIDSNMEALSFAGSSGNDSLVADLRKNQVDILKVTTDRQLKFLAEKNKMTKTREDNKTKKYVADKQFQIARVNKN